MSAIDNHSDASGSAVEPSPDSQIADADNRADAKVVIVMFVALVLFAVHFASGWTFDF